MKNIAFVGPMHSGKTTAANYLVEQYGYERIGLADQVKYLASAALNELILEVDPERWFDGVTLNIREINTNKAVFRPFLQWLGTDFVREYLDKPNYWIEQFLDEALSLEKPVVCDDVRFPHEAEALRDAGFTVVRLYRPEHQRLASITEAGGNPDDLKHPSETAVSEIVSDQSWIAGDIEILHTYIDQYLMKELNP